MAVKPEPKADLATLADALTNCADTAALFKLASAPDFGEAAKSLDAVDLKRLRELYKQRKADLDGKTRLDVFDGEIINVVDIQFWHTDKYQNNDGKGVTLTYFPESEPTRRCRSMTTSSIVYRFATSACNPRPPTPSDPCRVMIDLVPVKDAERAAKGQKQWQFRILPTPTRDNGEEGSPF